MRGYLAPDNGAVRIDADDHRQVAAEALRLYLYAVADLFAVLGCLVTPSI